MGKLRLRREARAPLSTPNDTSKIRVLGPKGLRSQVQVAAIQMGILRPRWKAFRVHLFLCVLTTDSHS